jgi:hypothetical protein
MARDRRQAGLVPPTSVELLLFDAKVRRELGVVAAHSGNEALGVFAGEQHVDGFAERVPDARSVVENHEDAHAAGASRMPAACASLVHRRSGFRLPAVVSDGSRKSRKPLVMRTKVASSRS